MLKCNYSKYSILWLKFAHFIPRKINYKRTDEKTRKNEKKNPFPNAHYLNCVSKRREFVRNSEIHCNNTHINKSSIANHANFRVEIEIGERSSGNRIEHCRVIDRYDWIEWLRWHIDRWKYHQLNCVRFSECEASGRTSLTQLGCIREKPTDVDWLLIGK